MARAIATHRLWRCLDINPLRPLIEAAILGTDYPWIKVHIITEDLHPSDIFKGLTDAQCARVVQRGQHETFQTKRTLFLQGDPADKFYMVHRGRLKLSRLNELGKEATIRYIGAGE